MTYKQLQSRFSKHIILIILFISILLFGPASLSAEFTDTNNHWAKSYIDLVSSKNVVSGYPDNTFKPDNNIKRIEFITMILNSQNIEVQKVSDDSYWGLPYIQAALVNNLISYNEYGNMDIKSFNQNISREEMASIVVNAYNKSSGFIDPLVLNNASLSLKDYDKVSSKYYDNAIKSVALNFINGYPDKTFAPKENASRSEASIISYRLLLKQGVISEKELKENIIISSSKIDQGDVLKITINHLPNSSKISLVQDIYSDVKWYDNNGSIQAYIPTNYNTKPGGYNLNFTNTETGNKTTKNIQVMPRDFRVQYLKISTTIESNTRTEEANEEYRKYFHPAVATSSPSKYYTESFILPTKGRLTTEFGETRTVNGAPTSYRHSGLDIAAPKGTEVLSTNRGKVALAMPLILTGNTIVIDHGEGLFSVYLHMDKLFVSKDQMVERGQLIGAVGSTGFSTGPHLHFTMSYYRTNIEPGYFIYGKSVTKQNYTQLMK